MFIYNKHLNHLHMEEVKTKSGKKRGYHLVCVLFGHDFDPIKACSDEDEYCHRCGKKCDEHDRWFEWRWWLKWKILPLKRWILRINGSGDSFTF
jgi:hypothetical protein